MALVVGCGVALAVAVATDRGTATDHAPSTFPGAHERGDAQASADNRMQELQSGQDDAYERLVDDGAPPEDPITEQWDELSAAERVRIQRARFDEAIARADAGEQVERNLAAARDALTALRPELHASAAGKAEHAQLEAQFDALAEGGEDPARRKE